VRARTAFAAVSLIAAFLGVTATSGAATLSVSDAAAPEGQAVAFTVSLDAPSESPVLFDFATSDGTAKAAKDYEATSGTAAIPAGQTSVVVAVVTKEDKLVEPVQTLALDLASPSGATLADPQGVGSIANVAVAGKCANLLTGTKAAETLTGTERSDKVTGLDGADVIAGLAGDDCLLAGPGDDRVDGGPGSDELDGRGGADRLKGGDGDDDLSGGGDGDRLDGGAGDDKINAGGGKNRVQGGPGNDNVATQNGKRDRVDCGPGGHDKVRADEGDKVKNCEIRVARK
jgi:Ca2+-binding RTX toxin-like protein